MKHIVTILLLSITLNACATVQPQSRLQRCPESAHRTPRIKSAIKAARNHVLATKPENVPKPHCTEPREVNESIRVSDCIEHVHVTTEVLITTIDEYAPRCNLEASEYHMSLEIFYDSGDNETALNALTALEVCATGGKR